MAAAVLLLLQRILPQSWLKELATRFAIVSSSVAFCTFFVSDGRIFTSYVGVIDQYRGWMIGTSAAFLTLTILFWRQLYLLNKQDRGK